MRSLFILSCAICLVCIKAAVVEPNYATALGLGWVFYEAQQSGNLPCWNRVAWWQPGGWRVSSHIEDGKSDGLDLSGGWYDAGDHIKATQAMAWSVSTLAWGALEFSQAYDATMQKPIMMRNLKWAADWLVKAHYQASDDPKKNALVGQVGDPSADHKKWWKPNDEPNGFCRAVMKVTCDRPGADVASEVAAALTAVSIIFKDTDAAYSSKLLTHAKQLYAFAKACPGIWSLTSDATIYPSNSFRDDMAWAAAWLCKADPSMCKEAVQMWQKGMKESNGKYNSDWDNVFPQATVLLMSTSLNTDRASVQPYISYMEKLLYYWQDSVQNCTKDSQDYHTCISPNGILFTTRWGNVPKAANVALLTLAYAKYLTSKANRVTRRCWARQQVSLMLGGSGRSYMVGFGSIFPKSPHHRAASCPTDACTQCGVAPFNLNGNTSIDGVAGPANPNVLWGALVGGQDNNAAYTDALTNYQQNEAAVDWNAGITGALAGMVWFSNAFPGITWQAYCAQNVMQSEDALFDDSTPSTAVPVAAAPTLDVNVTVPALTTNSAAQSPTQYWKTFLDPHVGKDKCGGDDNAAGPATMCKAPTVVDPQYVIGCQSNYYGPRKPITGGAASSGLTTGLLAAIFMVAAVLWL